jgi:hypothetical protein
MSVVYIKHKTKKADKAPPLKIIGNGGIKSDMEGHFMTKANTMYESKLRELQKLFCLQLLLKFWMEIHAVKQILN